MSIELRELLQNYVERHNAGVRSGDFTSLFELFAPDAEFVFHEIELGPFHGDEIAAAFGRVPPDDELVLMGDATLTESEVASAYGWNRSPDRRAGKLQIVAQRGRIVRLEIWADPN